MKKDDKNFPRKFVGIASSVMVVGVIAVATFHIVKKHNSSPAENKTKAKTVMVENNSSVAQNSVDSKKKAFINPPLKGKDIPCRSYSVDVVKGGSFTYKGSKITVPANIFCDAKGNDIKGSVDIKYREFHNPVEFFLSGIPMTYDSGGQQFTFVSAGMLDIHGEQNGTPVNIKEGKSIQIEMASAAMNGDYNIYELDTVNRKWVFKKTDAQDTTKVVQTPACTLPLDVLQRIKYELDSLADVKPILPRLANEKNLSFSLSVNAKDFPYIADYTNTIFETDNQNTRLRKEYGNRSWSNISINRKRHTDMFFIMLSNDTESHSFEAYPVFDPKDYKKAVTTFNKKQAEYLTAMERVKKECKGEIDVNDMAMLDRIIMKVENNVMNTATCMWRYFQVNKFGVWNSDRPDALPVGAELTANFQDDKKDSLNCIDIYLVDKDKNALFIYHPGHNCRFTPSSTNLAWCVTGNNKIAVFTPEQFRKITVVKGNYTFNMNVIDKQIASDDDVESILNKYL
jgi:hypothetical protein